MRWTLAPLDLLESLESSVWRLSGTDCGGSAFLPRIFIVSCIFMHF